MSTYHLILIVFRNSTENRFAKNIRVRGQFANRPVTRNNAPTNLICYAKSKLIPYAKFLTIGRRKRLSSVNTNTQTGDSRRRVCHFILCSTS